MSLSILNQKMNGKIKGDRNGREGCILRMHFFKRQKPGKIDPVIDKEQQQLVAVILER